MIVEVPNTEIVVEDSLDVSVDSCEVEVVDLADLDVTVSKKEYVITGDEIYIPMLYDDAPQWMKDLVQVVVDVAVDSSNQGLVNDLNAIVAGFATSYVPLNQYTQSIVDLSDEDGRLNALIETLNSNFSDGLSDANAQIVSLQLTKASKDEVVAQVIQTIAAQLADNSSNIGATIGRIDQAIADETSARASSFEVLASSLEDTNLDVTANANATHVLNTYVGLNNVTGAPNGTGLLADVSAIASDVTTLSTDLQSGAGTWASADSALTNSLSTSIVNGDAVVESKFAYNSIVGINGVYKKSGFGLTTNYVSGSGTQVDPYVSEFWIDASRFKFTNSNVTGSVAPFTIDASGVTPQITFNGIVNFSNVSNIQNSGSNLLYNSAPKIGYETKGWSIGWSNHGLSSVVGAGYDTWKPTGGASVYIRVYGSPAVGSVFDITNSSFPVVAGNKYEASAYISSHRCTSWVTIAWYNSSDAYISESSGTIVNLASSGALSGWARSTLIAAAPTGAVKGLFYVRSNVTSNDPYCFVSYAFAGKVLSNQTVVSDWSEGTSVSISSGDVVTDINAGNTTTINGGKITTGSITASQIAANSISADRISSYNLTAVNASIQSGMITNAMIGNAQINNAKIANLSVDTIKIADQAVTIPFSVLNTSSVTVNSAYVTVASVSTVSSGAPTTLTFSCNLSAGSLRFITARVIRNGTVLYDAPTTSVGQSAGQYGNLIFVLKDIPPAGTNTYVFDLYSSASSTVATYASIIGLEVKK